ncbi:hypothetical protein CP488_01690 [Chthonomonas calidirosea]|nr:hypothetical protein CP488_01690 [Chthonomonas calidirosea]
MNKMQRQWEALQRAQLLPCALKRTMAFCFKGVRILNARFLIALLGLINPLFVLAQPPLPSLRLRPSVVPPGSFLVTPVESTRELVIEVRTNRMVAARYLHHYNLSSLGELELALAQLRFKRLSSAHVLPVWYVHHDAQGHDIMGYRMRRLPAGTPAFVDANGTPVLIAVCGNPIGNIQLPPPKSVVHNLFNVTTPNLSVAMAPSSPSPSAVAPAVPEQIKSVEVALSPSLAPLVPPGLPEAHVTGGFPYGALGLPFLFHGGGHGSSPPLLGALPPQFSASGAQTPHGFVPEGGLGSLILGFSLPLTLFTLRKRRQQVAFAQPCG